MAYINQVAFLRETKGEQVAKAYSCWLNMRKRVRSPNANREKCYKNVTIDESWNDFYTFLNDMGTPEKNQSIDRIDNSLGYSKSNCRWANAITQSRNRKCVKLSLDVANQIKDEYFGTKTTQQKLAKKFGVSQNMISCVVRGKNWVSF